MSWPDDYIPNGFTPFHIEDAGIIFNCDCQEILPKFPDNCIDLSITSPPYNVGLDYGNGWAKDRLNVSEYKNHADSIMVYLNRITKTGGRFCIEIGGSGRNLPLSWIWQYAAYKAQWGLFSEITIPHRKTNPTAWGSYLKADNVYTIPNFHMAYIFYKDLERKEGDVTEITKEEFVEWTRGYWKINYSGRETNHPAEFPKELPARFMKLVGHSSDVILDFYLGSGTTAVAAKELGRKFIGVEISEEYCALSVKRLRQGVMNFG